MEDDYIGCFAGKYRWLSNFYYSPISFGKYSYPTIENAYQAAKSAHEEEIIDFTIYSPGEAKRAGQLLTLRHDWNTTKLNIMWQLIKRKFTESSYLGDKLIDTGDIDIIEGNTWGDTYWGVCNGVGSNHLGKLIMRQRGILIRDFI